MKKITPVYVLLLITFCALTSRLHASSMFMGNMTTIGPYGAHDAARNPALLSAQEKNNAIGLTARYQMMPLGDININQYQPVKIMSEYDLYKIGSGRVSYARVVGRLTLGFDHYFNMQSSTISQKIYAYTGNLVLAQGTSKESNMANLFTFALSAALDSSHSFGIRLNCSYISNKKRDTIRYLQVSLPPVYVYNLDKSVYEEVSTLPCLGYFGKIGVSEIGIMATPGRFSWKKIVKETLIYDLSSIMAQLLYKAKGELPFWFSYNMGPSVLAGFKTRPSYDIGLGLEMEVSFPVAYRDPFLISGEKMSNLYARLNYFSSTTFGLKNRVLIKPSVWIRGGGEFNVSRTAVFNLGAGFGYNVSPSSATGLHPSPLETFFSDYRIVSVLGTAGFDFLIGKNSTISLGTSVTYYTFEQKQALRESLSLFATKLNVKSVTLDLTAAASIGF
ncbi:MAG TPA: hypothetical protein PK307_10525 [Spirochaetota bacterium]|nr:hypothetical protein [Spirochaetota bacterium]HOD14788.1 hypothetical protein [Spirochaetota bacterium]HPG49112.1 hypothetical protein [Spirochaetota bacterium]HPN11163.1 hypothetical protein [Spirochaetota bacterium]HQL82628.1 hypothetical protein [Spirochaetota bacterium]